MQKQKTLFILIMLSKWLIFAAFLLPLCPSNFARCQIDDILLSIAVEYLIFYLLTVTFFFLIKKIITYYRFLVRYLLYYYRFTSMTMTTTRFFWLSQDLWNFLVLSSFIDKASLPQIKTCNLLFIFLGISKNLDQIVLSTLKEIHCSNNKYLHDPNKVMA